MVRSVIVLSVLSLLSAPSFAAADAFDDCVQDCAAAQAQCVEGITQYDDTGVREAKQICANEQKACKDNCRAEDAKGADEARQEALKKEAEEAEKRRQEQQETLNGTIKILDLNK